MITKICFKCGIEWPIHFFYKHFGMADGHLNKCKKCTKTDVRQNRVENIDFIKEYDKLRELRPKRKEDKRIATLKYREKHPEKYKARTAVGNALRDKRLFKHPCCVCGEKKVQAHHEDYTKPLQVIWVCIKHHRDIE